MCRIRQVLLESRVYAKNVEFIFSFFSGKFDFSGNTLWDWFGCLQIVIGVHG